MSSEFQTQRNYFSSRKI